MRAAMARSSLAAFTSLWRAYGQGRLEQAEDLIDPACELVMPGNGRRYRGHDGVRRFLAEAREEWKTLTITYDEVHEPHPGCVVGVGRVLATSADGRRSVDRPLACVAEFREGSLVRGTVFGDRDEALRYARRTAG
jgi:ketosteroid isomerase-like protein